MMFDSLIHCLIDIQAKPLNEYKELEKLEKAKKYKNEGNQLVKQSYKTAIKKYGKH